MGSAPFSLPALEALLQSSHRLTGVITNPDEPSGRGLTVKSTPVAGVAKSHGIDLLTPDTLKNNPDVIAWIRARGPDAIVVVAYGKFIPSGILHLPVHGCLNLHPSLLPRYRGAAPVQRAIMNAETETGVTIMRLDEGMDSGPVFMQEKIAIDITDDGPTLGESLARIGAGTLLKTLDRIERQTIEPVPQNHGLATIAPKIRKEEGRLDFNRPAMALHNAVRALVAWPTAWTIYAGAMVQVLRTEPLPAASAGQPGTVMGIDRSGIHTATSDGVLLIKSVKPSGGRAMDALSYANGRRIKAGDRFG